MICGRSRRAGGRAHSAPSVSPHALGVHKSFSAQTQDSIGEAHSQLHNVTFEFTAAHIGDDSIYSNTLLDFRNAPLIDTTRVDLLDEFLCLENAGNSKKRANEKKVAEPQLGRPGDKQAEQDEIAHEMADLAVLLPLVAE